MMNLNALGELTQKVLPESLRLRVSSLLGLGSGSSSASQIRLACDLGGSKLFFLEIQKIASEVTLQRFIRIQRPEEGGDLPALLKQGLTDGKFISNKIRIAVKGQGVILRFVQFPAMTDEELRGAISFEAEKYIPFKSDEVVVDYQILDNQVQTEQGKMMNVLLVAAKRDEIYKTLEMYQNAGLEVELIDIDALAFMNAVEFLYPEESAKTLGILDFGSELSTLGICKGGKPLFIRDISFGSQDLAKRIKRKLGLSIQEYRDKLTGTQASDELQAAFHEIIAPFASEIRVSLDYYKDQMSAAEIPQTIFLSGVVGAHPLMASMLSKEFGGLLIRGIEVLDRVHLGEGISLDDLKNNEAVLPVALGLCLRDL